VTDRLLHEEIALQIGFLEATIRELVLLRRELADREPTVREIAAASAFLADFYGGVENILKRISFHRGVSMPTGDNWHTELFLRFCSPNHPELPCLIDKGLKESLAAYRRFRHVAHHGYVMQLEWSRMEEGVSGIETVFANFKTNLQQAGLLEK
jgi:hypothetical protein